MIENLDNWKPLSIEETKELLSKLTVPWWIAGGWAIDLFVGKQTRPHQDTDVAILRKDQFEIQKALSGWDLFKTQQPGLKSWLPNEFLEPGVNDIWCRKTPDSPWSFQFMLLESDGDNWVFRRNPGIRRPVEYIGKLSPDGIPYLAPEIQLLFKARPGHIEKDNADFDAAAPLMDKLPLTWLLSCLETVFPDGHAWIKRLREINSP